MPTSASEFKNVALTKCAHCGQPFRIKENHVECWCSSDRKFFCNESCAHDAEQAKLLSSPS
jgi:hypothetical protein